MRGMECLSMLLERSGMDSSRREHSADSDRSKTQQDGAMRYVRCIVRTGS